MQRKNCSNCGFGVSNTSTWCPKCGVPAPRFGMGRWVAFAVGGAIVLLLVLGALLVWEKGH